MNPLKERADRFVYCVYVCEPPFLAALQLDRKFTLLRGVQSFPSVSHHARPLPTGQTGKLRENSPHVNFLLRKEVIQPQVPLRLPCYDFTPVTNPTFAGGFLAVSPTVFWLSQLPWCDGRCVQGPGTYSPRRADPRLLAIPTSWSRVADSNPN